MVAELAEKSGAQVDRLHELGGTQILWKALLRGAIDIYPEYTGTISEEALAGQNIHGEEEIRKALTPLGIRMSRSLGFDDTYAVGVKEEKAAALGLRTLSDLRAHPELRFGFSNEFMKRKDGLPSLQARYRLNPRSVTGLEHDLAYVALDNGSIDATDLYSTDAEIRVHHLRVLEDDLHHFPSYKAVLLYRQELAERAPASLESILKLEGAISAEAMTRLNARAKVDRLPPSQVAADFLTESMGIAFNPVVATRWQEFWQHTAEHLFLVSTSLAAAIAIALPLGIIAARYTALGQVLLALAGILQTIPSLALLVLLIPLLGLRSPPALVALFLYSLLPILRNTCTGLRDIPTSVLESAQALGLPAWARLWRVELPLASRTILAGIKTSAVINVGTATLGAIIGAGGYGQPIMTGIRLDDLGLILWGAIPAAGLALLVQGGFELAERWLVPRGLRGE
jgi:osmoprotectant transport system permease protein